MNNSEFISLHNHTDASFFDGLAKIPDLVMQARKMRFKSLAITDHGNVSGWIKFYQECKKKKDKKDKEIPYDTIKPILGIETYFCRDLKARGMEGQPAGRKGNHHLILLAKNQQGYENICTLSQTAFLEGQAFGDPRIDMELLSKYSSGIIVTSACLKSVINQNLYYGRYEEAKKCVHSFKDIFKEDFFLEIQYHGIDAQAQIIPDIFKLGKETNTLVIASGDVHYVHKNQADSHTILMAMHQKKCIKDEKSLKQIYGEFYLKSADEMYKIWKSHPEVMSNTLIIDERIEDFLKLGGMRLPKFDIADAIISTEWDEISKKQLKEFGEIILNKEEYEKKKAEIKVPNGLNAYEFLKVLAWQGMRKVGLDKSEAHIKRLNMELEDTWIAFENNGYDFATYFLIVWDYINFARRKNILTSAGRGSGYASLLLRVIGITYGSVDILDYKLIWERFLAFDNFAFIKESDLGFEDAQEVIPINSNEEEVEDVSGASRY